MEEKGFGPGVAHLLTLVRQHHSLRGAALEMGMAYSKAWKIVHQSEEVFGCKLLLSTTGGRGGGGADLSPQAEALLAAYEAYCDDMQAYSDTIFERYFGFLEDGTAL